MEMLPQPPAGVSPPPADQTARRSWSWLAWIVIGGFGSLLVLLVLVVKFGVKSYDGKGYAMIKATSNARQIGAALYEFQDEYGSCPSPSTVQAVKENTGTTWRLEGRTANGLLKQLIVTEMMPSEDFCWCYGSGKKPDNAFASEADALAKGECGFTYVVCDSSVAPRLVAPLIPGTMRFDPKPFDGKAVVLFGDGHVAHFPIKRSGDVVDPTGKNLFDPSQPHWRGKPFEVFYPE